LPFEIFKILDFGHSTTKKQQLQVTVLNLEEKCKNPHSGSEISHSCLFTSSNLSKSEGGKDWGNPAGREPG
jgi:hypothetical protein